MIYINRVYINHLLKISQISTMPKRGQGLLYIILQAAYLCPGLMHSLKSFQIIDYQQTLHMTDHQVDGISLFDEVIFGRKHPFIMLMKPPDEAMLGEINKAVLDIVSTLMKPYLWQIAPIMMKSSQEVLGSIGLLKFCFGKDVQRHTNTNFSRKSDAN